MGFVGFSAFVVGEVYEFRHGRDCCQLRFLRSQRGTGCTHYLFKNTDTRCTQVYCFTQFQLEDHEIIKVKTKKGGAMR